MYNSVWYDKSSQNHFCSQKSVPEAYLRLRNIYNSYGGTFKIPLSISAKFPQKILS